MGSRTGLALRLLATDPECGHSQLSVYRTHKDWREGS